MLRRRDFLKTGMASFGSIYMAERGAATPAVTKHTFKLKYAPHFGFFKNIPDELDRLSLFAAYGFKAFEFNGLMQWQLERVEQLKKRMDDLGMEMGVFVANPDGWKTAGMVDPEQRPAFLDQVRKAMTYADITKNTCLTVITGPGMEKPTRGEQRVNVIESLRRAADIVENHRVTLVVEPLNTLVNHPGYFLSRSDEAYEIMRAVNSSYIKILFDIYHQQITEGNLINNIQKFRDEIGYIQLGDNPGRHEPGTGEVNYRNVFKAIYEMKLNKIVGMEFSASDKREPEGSEKVMQAMVEADDFL